MLTFHLFFFFFLFPSSKNVFPPWSCPSLLGAVLCPRFWKLWCAFMWRAKDLGGLQVRYDDVVNRFIFVLEWQWVPEPRAPHCVRYSQHRAGAFPAQRASGWTPQQLPCTPLECSTFPSFLRGTLGYTFSWINYSSLGKLGLEGKGERKIN